MLFNLLKSNTILGIGLAYLISATLLVLGFIEASAASIPDMLLSHWAFHWAETNSVWIFIISISSLVGGLILSRLRFRESRETLGKTNVAMIAFAAIVATQTKLLIVRPDIMVSQLIIIGFFMLLFSTYKRDTALSEVFHIGLMVAISSLFVGQAIMFLLPVVFSIIITRSTSLKDWTVLVLGVLMAVVFVWMFVIWSEKPFQAFMQVIQTSWVSDFGAQRLTVGHISLLMVSLYAVVGSFSDITLGTVHERNFTLVNLSWVAGCAIIVLLLGLSWQAGLIFCAFPLSNFIARSLNRAPKWWIADLVLVFLLASPFIKNLWQI